MAKDVRTLLMVCPNCKGDGWTSEHGPNDPHENGCSTCPVQMPCDLCDGTGIVWREDIAKEPEPIIEQSDLPF